MSVLRVFAKRIGLGIVASWGVITTVFLAFTLSEDWVRQGLEGQLRFIGVSEQELEQRIDQYMAERGLDQPLHQQYVDWLWSAVSLDWGNSFATGEPATSVVFGALVRTGMYVVPAIVLGVVIGMLVGFYAALNPESRFSELGRIGSYLLFSVPAFWIGGLFVGLLRADVIGESTLLFEHALPIALATASLLGGYVSYSRAHALEYASADFVTLVRAKGARPLLITRHVIRNAAIPLFSMLFTEALALLVLAVFVIEVLFGIRGFGIVFFEAIQTRDLPVLLGGTLVIIAFGVVGNIIQDLSYGYLDPRVDADSR